MIMFGLKYWQHLNNNDKKIPKTISFRDFLTLSHLVEVKKLYGYHREELSDSLSRLIPFIL